MVLYKHFSFRTLILSHELALLLLIVIIMVLSITWAYSWQQHSKESVRIQTLLYLIEQIKSELQGQVQQVVRARMLDDENAPDRYRQHSKEIQHRFNELRGKADNRNEDKLIQTLQVMYRSLQQDMNRIFISKHPTRVKILILDPGFAQRNMGKFEEHYLLLKKILLNRHTELLSDFLHWTKWAGVMIGSAFILALLLVFYTRKAFLVGVVKPMSSIIADAKIISQGQLDKKIEVQGVTEIANLAETINEMTTELAENRDILVSNEKQIALGALVPVVAHNIRNPLASIRVSAQLLDLNDDIDEFKQTKQEIISTIDRLGRWVNALVSYLHPLKPNYQLVYADEMLEASLALLKPKLTDKKIKVVKTCWDKQRLNVDPDLMEQAIYALMTNAVEASKENGTLKVGIKKNDLWVEFYIQDEGSGISFSPEPSTLVAGPSTKRMGTGLGIPIAFKICQKHGWKLSIEKTPTVGTLVTIRAPIRVVEE